MSTEHDQPDHTLRVRPYARTGGRTRPARDLAIETLVRSTLAGLARASRLTLEHQDIITMCVVPLSLAEISAHLKVPIGVVRVLVADLYVVDLLEISEAIHVTRNERPDVQLLERVLDGLQSL